MSRVMLIAADKPLPLCDHREMRTKVVKALGKEFRITSDVGFQVEEHGYYRGAVDALGLTLKPWQYGLSMELCETDLNHLLAYLRDNHSAGETVELWNLWVGIDREDKPAHYRGKLSELDMDTLKQFLEPETVPGKIGQCKLTITI